MKLSDLTSIEQDSRVVAVYLGGSYATGLATAESDLDLVVVISGEPYLGEHVPTGWLSACTTLENVTLKSSNPDVEIERITIQRFSNQGSDVLGKICRPNVGTYEQIVEYFEWCSLSPLWQDPEISDVEVNRGRHAAKCGSVVSESCFAVAYEALAESDRAICDGQSLRAARYQKFAAGSAISGWLASKGQENPKEKWRTRQIDALKAAGEDVAIAERLQSLSNADVAARQLTLLRLCERAANDASVYFGDATL